jgi:hypothetical protein
VIHHSAVRRACAGLCATLALIACSEASTSPPSRRSVASPIPDTPPAAFLAAFMTSKDERGMYYAISTDGHHFEPLYAGHAVLRSTLDDRLLRDPMLFRDRTGRYHLVATISWTHRAIVMWDSDDLVAWTNERLIHTGPAKSTKAWAPEIFYDAQRDRYVLVVTADQGNWASTAFYAMTTTDFETFSPPTLLYRDPSTGVIDATIVADAGRYHLFFRGEGIFHATATDAMGPYTGVTRIIPDLLEGPFVFRHTDGSGWTMLLDNFKDNAGYTVLDSPDLYSWTRLTNPTRPLYNASASFPFSAREGSVRHGSVIPVSQAQLDTLRAVFDRRAHRRDP